MKKITYLISIAVVALISVASVVLIQGCQKERYNDTEFLYLDDVNKTSFSQAEWRIIREADKRMSGYLIMEGDKISLGKITAADLAIDQRLFDKWHSVIDLVNNSDLDIPVLVPITRMYPMEPYPDDGILEDIGAVAVTTYFKAHGCPTAAKYFNMYHYQERSSSYSLSSSEWSAVYGAATVRVGQNFRNNPVVINGQTFYRNSVSFYNSSPDLRFSYGTAIVYFNEYGLPAGFHDRYDFNAGNRDGTNEALTNFGNILGGGRDGYDINYGVTPK